MLATTTHAATTLLAAPLTRVSEGSGHAGLLCTVLLVFTLIALIVGLADLLGIRMLGDRTGNGRFAPLLVGVILLVIYLVLC